MSWLNPKFKYRGSVSHDDSSAFRRRMKARTLLVQRDARRTAKEAEAKVRQITTKRKATA